MAAKRLVERGVGLVSADEITGEVDNVAIEGENGVRGVVTPLGESTRIWIETDTQKRTITYAGFLKPLEELHTVLPSTLVSGDSSPSNFT